MSYVYPKLEIEDVYIGDILGFLNLRILRLALNIMWKR